MLLLNSMILLIFLLGQLQSFAKMPRLEGQTTEGKKEKNLAVDEGSGKRHSIWSKERRTKYGLESDPHIAF